MLITMDNSNNERETTAMKMQVVARDVESLNGVAKSDGCEHSAECCVGTGIVCTSISVIGGIIVYTVFCIIALCSVSLRTTQNHCEESNMWVWLLVMVINNATSGSANSSSNSSSKDDKNPCVALCSFIISLGLIGWGSYEMWGVSCADDLSNYLVYKMSFATLIITYSLLGAFMIGGVIVCFKKK